MASPLKWSDKLTPVSSPVLDSDRGTWQAMSGAIGAIKSSQELNRWQG